MELDELKNWIRNKTFKSTNGMDYQFIPENTLSIKNGYNNLKAHYEIKEENGKFILHYTDFLLGTEPIIMEIISDDPNQITLAMTKIYSGDFIGTWTEQ